MRRAGLLLLAAALAGAGCIDFDRRADGQRYCNGTDPAIGVCQVALEAVSPTEGSSGGGTLVRISGAGFEEGAEVLLDGQPLGELRFEDGGKTAIGKTPAHPAGPVPVEVRGPAGAVARLAAAFTFVDPPALARTWPSTIPANTATELLLEGSGFRPGMRATIGGTEVALEVLEPTRATIWVGAAPAGALALTLETAFGLGQGTIAVGPWVELGLAERFGGGRVNVLAPAGAGSDRVYAATGGGVFISDDGGNSWTRRSNGIEGPRGELPEALDVGVDPVDPNIAYAATPAGVFATASGGKSWRKLLDLPCLQLEVDSNGRLYVALEAGVPPNTAIELRSSADRGATFQPLPANGLGRVLALSADALGRTLAIADGSSIVLWPVGSAALQPVEAGIEFIRAARFLTVDGVESLYVSNKDGVRRVDDAATGSTTLIASRSAADLGVRRRSGASDTLWLATSTGVYPAPFADSTRLTPMPAKALATLPSGEVVVGYVDAGVTRSTPTNALVSSSTGLGAQNWTAVAIHPNTPTLLVAAAAGLPVLRSTDGGATWSAGPAGFPVSGGRVTGLKWAYDTTLGWSLYATVPGDGVYRSSNGLDWTPLTSPGATTTPVLTLNALAAQGRSLLVGTDAGLYVSGDNGATWVLAAGTNAPSGAIVQVAFSQSDVTHYCAAGTTAVSCTTDGGASWSRPLAAGTAPTLALSTNRIAGLVWRAGEQYHLDSSGFAFSARTPTGLASAPLGGGALEFAPSSTRLFAAHPTDGLFASGDDGDSWAPALTGMRTRRLRALSVQGAALVLTGGDGTPLYLSTTGGQ